MSSALNDQRSYLCPAFRWCGLLVILFLLGTTSVIAQENLTTRRTQLENQLRQTSRQLKATKSRKGAALQQAGHLKTQIAQREELIGLLEEEATRNAAQLYQDSTAVASLDQDLEGILGEYTRIIRAANRARLMDGWTQFIFRAESLNDLFRRAIYLRQYRKYRVAQARAIRRTKLQLDERLATLTAERQLRDSLLFATVDQEAILQQELAIQDGIVDALSVEERSLLARIRKQEKQAEQLRRQITTAIQANEKKRTPPPSRTRDSGTTGSGKPTGTVATTNSVSRGANIANRKGRLGWPVAGSIVQRFGRQPHPDVPSIMVDYRGVKIRGRGQDKIVAIHPGTVVEVVPDGNGRTLVLVSHGSFYSVYSNVEFPQVRKGGAVDAGDQLALLAADGSPLQFELWRGKVALDPEKWLE